MPRIRYTGVNKNIPMGTTNKHRRPYPTLAREVIRVSDIILEILDARFIDETRNLIMEEDIKRQGKKIIYVINKADLISINELLKSGKLKDVKPYILLSCKANIGRSRLRDMIRIEVKRLRKENADMLKKVKEEKLDLSGELKEKIIKIDKRAHVGIIGYPNTGKSTLTNILTGKGAARAASEAGFTRGIQKVRFNKDILILDSPGVISENENSTTNVQDFKKHAKIGIRTHDKVHEPEFVVAELMKEYPGEIEMFYDLEVNGDSELLLDSLGRKWGFLLKGNVVDVDRTARRVIKAWQSGIVRKGK